MSQKTIRRKLCIGRQPMSGLQRYSPIHYYHQCSRVFTARIRRMGKVMFSVCSHLGGGGVRSSQGGGVRSVSRQGGSGPAGGGVRSSWGGSGPARGGWVRSSQGGSGQSADGGGQVQPGGGSGPAGRGVSILCPLAGDMPLAFMQEDFLVHNKIKFYILRQNLHQTCFNDFSNVKWCMKQTSI